MADVRIRLLGGFDVATDGRPITEFESGSARALLARLAAEPGRPLSRGMLAELLWPDRPARAAAGNLRHCLSTVRKAIGDVDPDHPILVASRTDIALDAGAGVRIDLTEFDRLSSIGAIEPDAVGSWERAVELRRGPFLAGFDVELSEGWDTWLLTMRTAVDDAATASHRRLAELRERTGERKRALDHVRLWLELDPWNEHAHRMLIRLLVHEDQRGAALLHADQLAAALRSELGIEPSPETRALVDDIREERFPVVVAEVPALAPRVLDGSPREPCVGRSEELGWLRRHLDDSQAGSGSVVFVIGQPGSGKTVLLHRFERAVLDAMPNLVVVRGRCTAHRRLGDPFLPFRQVLGELLGDLEVDWANGLLTPRDAVDLWRGIPDSVAALLDHGPQLLGTLVDAEALCGRFEQGFPGHPLTPRLRRATADARLRSEDPTRRRQPLVEQCARVLTTVARQRPMLISVDDLQWADSGTLDVLVSLAAKTEGVPLLVVAALRPGEVEQSQMTAVSGTVNEMASRAHESRRLELTGSAEFVDAWLDTEPNVFDTAFRSRLYDTTGGNALFTVELVRALKQSGQLAQDERGRWFADRLEDWDELPPRVEATIAARLAALPAELRHDLDVASLHGQEFSAQLVAGARGVPTPDVVLRLSRLCTAPSSLLRSGGLAIVGGRKVDRFRFRHALFQQHLADHLAPAARSQLHESIGAALEELHAGCPDAVAGDLAIHFDAGGRPEKAVQYHSIAGQDAARLCAYDAAVRHFERALDLVQSLGSSVDLDKRQLVLLTSLGACHQAQYGYNAGETTAVYDQLRELTQQVTPSPESAAAIGSLLTVDGLRANYFQALAEAEQLLDLAVELESVPIETVARVQLGWMLLMVGRIVEADEQLTLAIDRYDPAWDDWLLPLVGIHVPSTAAAWQAITAWHLGHFDDAREAGDRSIELARAASFPFGLAFSLAVGGCVIGALFEDPLRISSSAAEMASIADDEDFAFYRAAAELHGGAALALSSEPRSGVEQMRRGLQRWAELGSEAFVTWSRTWLAEALVRSGELDAARRELAEIDLRLEHGEERLAELRRLLVEGALHAAEGDIAGAAASYRKLISTARAARARGPEQQARAALDALEAAVG
jgi:DNA-binding SARP family transcriptional activator/tetratricopeptide (TPR) repeat protein